MSLGVYNLVLASKYAVLITGTLSVPQISKAQTIATFANRTNLKEREKERERERERETETETEREREREGSKVKREHMVFIRSRLFLFASLTYSLQVTWQDNLVVNVYSSFLCYFTVSTSLLSQEHFFSVAAM